MVSSGLLRRENLKSYTEQDDVGMESKGMYMNNTARSLKQRSSFHPRHEPDISFGILAFPFSAHDFAKQGECISWCVHLVHV
jgi:hypothetical protein